MAKHILINCDTIHFLATIFIFFTQLLLSMKLHFLYHFETVERPLSLNVSYSTQEESTPFMMSVEKMELEPK